MRRLRRFSLKGEPLWAEAIAVLFTIVGVLRLSAGPDEAQVFVLVGLVWAVLAVARSGGVR